MAEHCYTLPAYGAVTPYRQGDLSSLCGIYAIINAARLLSPAHAGQQALWMDIYRLAAEWLAKKRKLEQSLFAGLTFDVWKELQHALYDELSELLGISFRMRPLIRRSVSSRQDPHQAIRDAIDKECAVLCALSGALDHYTIIAGYTATRWLLQDSYGYRWVGQKKVAFGEPQGTRHWVSYQSLVAVRQLEVGDEG